ncbi:MAG: hypothetical protein RIC56_15580 [Pseudomonadales bacterium]
MNYSGHMGNGRFGLVAALLLAAGAVQADITIEEQMRVEASGLMSMINMSATTRSSISGDRARMQSDVKMQSRVLRVFGGAGETAEIVRLDQKKTYQLDLKKKTYTEMTFEEQRAQMEQAMQQMREAQAPQQSATGVDEESCEWSPPETRVERTGETENIAGHATERKIVRSRQSCADPKTGQVCDFELTLDQWLAGDFPASEEAAEYFQRYADAMGLGAAGSRDFSQRLQSMFGGYKSLWSEMAGELASTDAYPLRTTVSMAIGGPQCTDGPAASADTPGVGEALGSVVGGTLGGIFGRRRDEAARQAKREEEAAQTAAAGDMVRLMSITTEFVSVSDAPVDPSAFEVPANFKSVSR